MSQKLEDLEEIRQLKYRYFRCIDTANLQELETLFAPDATVSYIGGTYRFEAEGRDKILEAISYGFHSECAAVHNGHHPEIERLSDTEALGTWYLSDWFLDLRNKIITDGTALYKDRYVKQDGHWVIQHSAYSRIWEIVTEFEEAPNLTTNYLGEHGMKLPPDMP